MNHLRPYITLIRSEAWDILQCLTSVPLMERSLSYGLILPSRAVMESSRISTMKMPGSGQLPLILMPRCLPVCLSRLTVIMSSLSPRLEVPARPYFSILSLYTPSLNTLDIFRRAAHTWTSWHEGGQQNGKWKMISITGRGGDESDGFPKRWHNQML